MLITTFRNGNFIVSVYNSLNSELQGRWDELSTDSLSSSYLSFIEDSKPLDLSFRYIFVEEENNNVKRLCAIIYLQVLRFTGKNVKPKKSLLLSTVANVLLSVRPFYIVVCGNLFAVNFPAIRYDQNKLDRKTILSILDEAVKKEKCDVFMLKDMDDEFTIAEMTMHGWSPYTADLTMTLTLDREWKSLTDYFSGLSKKYRKRSEKIHAAGKNIVRREMQTEEIKNSSSQIRFLFEQVASRQTIRMGLISDNYFYEYKRRFPETFSFTGYFYNDKLIAFATYIEHGENLEMHYIGLDYSYNKELMIYFNILLDGVERAVQKRKEQLELGRTAREAKANLGCKPVYFNDFIVIKNRLAAFLSKKFGSYFQDEMGESWTARHPFGK